MSSENGGLDVTDTGFGIEEPEVRFQDVKFQKLNLREQSHGRSYHFKYNITSLIGGYGFLSNNISRRLESTTSSSDINNVQHGGRTKSTCSGLVLEAEHLTGEEYHPWQQPGKRGFAKGAEARCQVERRRWDMGSFGGRFLISIVPSKRRIGKLRLLLEAPSSGPCKSTL